eukprot:m.468192 g.468192  ORF g.468192 m.468192 type:complete len:316 (+) comp57070_c0_seq20:1425-2372(+)
MLRPSSKQAQIFRCVTVMVSHACITRHLEGNPKCCAFCCKPTPRISTRRTEFVLPSGFPGSTIVTVFAAVCLRYSSSSQRGATALMLACYLAHAIELGEGRKMIIKLLLEAGADIFLQNKDGETAKDVLGQDRPEILRIFQEHEEYLSKIGSRTKPALRAVAPAAASQDPAEAVPLGLMLPSDLPIADDHGQSTVGDTSQGIEGQPADDSTHAVAVVCEDLRPFFLSQFAQQALLRWDERSCEDEAHIEASCCLVLIGGRRCRVCGGCRADGGFRAREYRADTRYNSLATSTCAPARPERPGHRAGNRGHESIAH